MDYKWLSYWVRNGVFTEHLFLEDAHRQMDTVVKTRCGLSLKSAYVYSFASKKCKRCSRLKGAIS